MLFPPAPLPSGPPHTRPPAPQPHLGPEFPVSLDSAWPPRPRSSSPASTTTERPMMSHTFGGGVVRGGGGGDQALSHHPDPPAPPPPLQSPTFSRVSSIRNAARPSASAHTLPRSPACCGAAMGSEWAPSRPPSGPRHPPGSPGARPAAPRGTPRQGCSGPRSCREEMGGEEGASPHPIHPLGLSLAPLGCPRPLWGCPHPL